MVFSFPYGNTSEVKDLKKARYYFLNLLIRIEGEKPFRPVIIVFPYSFKVGATVYTHIEQTLWFQHVPDTFCDVTGGMQFPPMLQSAQSKRLFETVQEAGRIIGLDVRGISTGGGSDGNHAAQYAPTLDGMGPQGSGAHSDREFMEVATLLERSKVTALFLAKWPEVVATL